MDLTWTQVATWAARPTRLVAAFAFLAFAVVLWPLERLWPAVRRQPVRRRGFGTDLLFWVFTPLVGKALTYSVVFALAAGLFALSGRDLDLSSTEGWGPSAGRRSGSRRSRCSSWPTCSSTGPTGGSTPAGFGRSTPSTTATRRWTG